MLLKFRYSISLKTKANTNFFQKILQLQVSDASFYGTAFFFLLSIIFISPFSFSDLYCILFKLELVSTGFSYLFSKSRALAYFKVFDDVTYYGEI